MTYYVVMNKRTGVALVTTSNPTSPLILFAVGARNASQVDVQKGANFQDVVDSAIGNLGISTDQIPTSYRPESKGHPYMPLSAGIKTAPFNTGSPLSPNLTQQQSTSIDQTITGDINSVLDFLKLIAWLFNPLNLLRAVEFLAGFVLLLFGLRTALQHHQERQGRFFGYGSFLRRSPIGRAVSHGYGKTDVERARERSAKRQNRGNQNTDTGRPRARKYKSSERGARRSDRDTRRNAQRSKRKAST